MMARAVRTPVGAYLLLGGAALLIVLAAVFSYMNLVEAFGSGPPYYSRTTNMDKWANPIPYVLAADSLASIAVFFAVRHARSLLVARKREVEP